MRHLFIVSLVLVMAGTVHAQFNILSVNQNVSASGWAQVGSLPQTNYSGSGSFSAGGSVSTSSGSLEANAASGASLSSALTETQINLTSELGVNTGIGLLGVQSGENCYAEADLSFSVSFSVLNPVLCNLSFQNMNDDGTEYNLNR